MIDAWITTITRLTAVKSVADLPKWVVAVGVVGSLIYVARRTIDAEADFIDADYEDVTDRRSRDFKTDG